MGRLIDADKLKENCKCVGTFDDNFKCVSLATLCNVIDAQLTAYDVDKVVEQLEELGGRYNSVDFGIKGIIYKAIEIVKAGGVDGNT